MNFETPRTSAINKWPTKEEPDNNYQYGSMVILFSQDIKSIERNTYSTLEWLGDIGGLFDALSALGSLISAPFTAMALEAELFIRFLPAILRKTTKNDSDKSNKRKNHSSKNFLCCWFKNKRSLFIQRIKHSLRHELDLVRFIKHRRRTTFGTIASLTDNQRSAIHRLSNLALFDSACS